MAEESFESLNSLTPIASFVHICLGIMALFLVSRSKDRMWNERLAGYIISWILIFLGLQYLFVSLIEYRVVTRATGVYNNYGGEIFYTFLTYGQRSFECGYTIGLGILPLIYPFPIIQRKSVVRILGIVVLLLGIVMIPFDIFTEFAYRNVRNIPSYSGYIIWTAIYMRFLFGEMVYGERGSRNISSVAALLLLAAYGKFYMFWLMCLSGLCNVFRGRFMVEDFVEQTKMSSTAEVMAEALLSVTFLAILLGEMWRAYKKGPSGLTYITGIIFLLGILWYLLTLVYMDNITSCVESACEFLSVAWVNWYVVTFQIALYLGVPLLFMFVMLNYNLVDANTGSGSVIGRTTVLLLLLVTSSTIIELIQLILPVPEMITSAVFAGAVVAFIGWEEKIMKQLISKSRNLADSISVVSPIPDYKISDGEFRFFSFTMLMVGLYAIIISFLFEAMGIHQ